MGRRLLLHSLLPAILGMGLAWSQASGGRLEQLLFLDPAGDTLFQIRFQDTEGGKVLRSHHDAQGFLLFRAISGPESSAYVGAAGDTLYRSKQIQAGDSVRITITDALGRALNGAAYPGSGGPAGDYAVRPDSLVGEITLRYVTTPDGRTDSIYVRQGGSLTHIVKAKYGSDVRIGKPAVPTGAVGFSHAHPGRVLIRFSPARRARKIVAHLHRLDGNREATLTGSLAAGQSDFILDIGGFSGRVPAGVYAVRFHLGTEELFRFRLTRP